MYTTIASVCHGEKPRAVRAMSTFASAFKAIVLPQLAPTIAFEASLMAAGCTDFSEAFSAVFSAAADRGLMHLSEDALQSFNDWLATQLLKQSDEAARRGEAFRAWLTR